MANIVVPDREVDPAWDFPRGLYSMPTSAWEVSDAMYDEALNDSLFNRAIRGFERLGERDLELELSGGKLTAETRESRGLSPLLSATEANETFGIKGHLTFPEGELVPEQTARQMNVTKRRELGNRDVSARNFGGGVGSFSAGLLGGAAGSLLDPVGTSVAILPIVGPAARAAMMARLGVTGGRLASGFTEGAVATALVEPAHLLLARQEQADYHMMDSLLNIAFGGVTGGGFQAGFGKLGDVLGYNGNEMALRGALAAVNNEAPVDVAPGIRWMALGEDAPLKHRLMQSSADVRPSMGRSEFTIEGRPGSVEVPIGQHGGTLGFDIRDRMLEMLPPELRRTPDPFDGAGRVAGARAHSEVNSWAHVSRLEAARQDIMKQQAVLDHLTGRTTEGTALRAQVTAMEQARLAGRVAETKQARLETRAEVKQAAADRKTAETELTRLEAKASPLQAAGVRASGDRQLAELEAQITTARAKVAEATALEQRAKFHDAEAKRLNEEVQQQIANIKSNAETVDVLAAPIERAKQEKGSLKDALAQAETDYRAAKAYYDLSLRQAREEARADVQAAVRRQGQWVPHPADAAAAKQVDAVLARHKANGTDTPTVDTIKADIVEANKAISHAEKALGRPLKNKEFEADIAAAKAIDAKAKAADAAAACMLLRG